MDTGATGYGLVHSDRADPFGWLDVGRQAMAMESISYPWRANGRITMGGLSPDGLAASRIAMGPFPRNRWSAELGGWRHPGLVHLRKRRHADTMDGIYMVRFLVSILRFADPIGRCRIWNFRLAETGTQWTF